MIAMKEDADNQTLQHSRRAFKRMFVYLDWQLTKATSDKKMEALKVNEKIAEICFTKNHSAADMGRLLLANFPTLLGISLKR